MNEDYQIFVWGNFGIPLNGSKKSHLSANPYSFRESIK
jgi:hypothetical protein